ncbi:MAG: PA2779 family protein [Desulfatiglans sp.]|nr:PA2779 family protein [Thermodesulfobacteriota bacterium]MEE4352653.1 PA2779 family protein [Desulfatiglans sp.]
MTKSLIKCVSWHLVIVMSIFGAVPNVYAGLSPSEAINLSELDRSSDLQRIQAVLETKMIKNRLDQLGFSEDDIHKRLRQLDDDQIHELALNLDEMKVGSGGFEVLVIILLIGILVAVWLHVTGKRVIVQ